MRSEIDSGNGLRPISWVVVGLVLVGLAIGLLPLLLHLSPPSSPGIGPVFAYFPAIVVAFLCYALDRTSKRKEKIDSLLLCVVFTFLTTYLHVWLVDLGRYFSEASNLEWQVFMQKSVLALSPDTLPHSYRFLPNSVVRLFEQVTGDFAVARDTYRNLFGVLLFYSFYRFSRLFLRHGGALFSLALVAVVLPVSFRYYAGQLTDPLSHLSFILAFIFLETEQFVYLLLSVMIGCLAKETIVAMSGYYLLFRWREQSYLGKSVVLVVGSLAVFEFARLSVLHGLPNYQQISGVTPDHIVRNWNDYAEWLPGLLGTVGIFVPFVAAGWQKSPWTLRSLAIYWFPVFFVSGLFFSWLREARNFVPLAAILVVLTVYHLMPAERTESIGDAAVVSSGPKSRGLGRLGSKKFRRSRLQR